MTVLAGVAAIVEIIRWVNGVREMCVRFAGLEIFVSSVKFNLVQLQASNPIIFLTATVTAAGVTVTRPRKRGRVEQNLETPVPLFSISAFVTAYREPFGRPVVA